MATHLNSVASALDPRNLMSSPTILRSYWGGGERVAGPRGGDLPEEEEEEEDVSRGTIELHMFSFGAPRVGNPIYAARYNDVVPHSFRVVVDGDPVPVSACFRPPAVVCLKCVSSSLPPARVAALGLYTCNSTACPGWD